SRSGLLVAVSDVEPVAEQQVAAWIERIELDCAMDSSQAPFDVSHQQSEIAARPDHLRIARCERQSLLVRLGCLREIERSGIQKPPPRRVPPAKPGGECEPLPRIPSRLVKAFTNRRSGRVLRGVP